MILNLVEATIDLGYPVDLLPVKQQGDHFKTLSQMVRVINLQKRHALTCIPGLIHYLKSEKPLALFAAKDRCNQAALLARALSGRQIPVAVRLGTNRSRAMQKDFIIKRYWRRLVTRYTYLFADSIIAVSAGVARDTAALTGIALDQIKVIPNPVITSRLVKKANEPLSHPWYSPGQPRVILACGRLTRQKGLSTLIKAFALVRKKRHLRLIILGEGNKRPELENLITKLGVKSDVQLPGFVPNPYPYMQKATLFVLSSLWEGSPNVLTEAMALGTPVVSTDCPSGPGELLQDGEFGPLVPVEDEKTLAEAILHVLDNPLPSQVLQQAVKPYRAEISAKKYLQAVGLG